MTDHINTLRLLHSFAAGDHREALEAAIERMSLPAIATCGDCSACKLHQRGGGMTFSEPRTPVPREHFWLCHHDGTHVNADRRVDAMAAPPAWCLLREKPAIK